MEDVAFCADEVLPSGYSDRLVLKFTYNGAFAFFTAQQRWIIDPSRILVIPPGRFFYEQHLVEGLGHSAILIWPSDELLDEIYRARSGDDWQRFSDVSLSAPMRLRLLLPFIRHAILNNDPVARDEWAICAVREAVRAPPLESSGNSRIVEKAKQLMNVRAGERVSLSEMAKDIGVTPVWLTQEFARIEGTPLYRFQLKHRLTRSLFLLEECADITGLALDLGFSSHSHFTAEFRKAFGLTPSRYRTALVSKPAHVRKLVGKAAAGPSQA